MSRKVNPIFDSEPSQHHIYNFEISKPYIKHKKIIDIGCWSGLLEKMTSKIASQATGVDPDSQAIKLAKMTVPMANFKVGSALAIPFKNEDFDTALMFEVIEHIPRNTEKLAFEEVNRILKNKGLFIMSTPNSHPISILLDPAFFLIAHRHYSIKQLKFFLEDAGFKILNIKITGGLFFLLRSILELIWKHVFRKRLILPDWYYNFVSDEYEKGGFATIHIIAQKISPPKMFS